MITLVLKLEHSAVLLHSKIWTHQRCLKSGPNNYVMGCSYACLEIKMMLDELICKYEAAMGIMLSQQPANLSAFKSHFAVLDNIFMAAYVHVCGSALYDVLEKHEAE